ncbi:MAG TPA: DUF1254 domain-containing protein [Acidimicrobiales bacterium]|nr:DUF1254 domain-containing protein [Acidimicrobiales bacterium]
MADHLSDHALAAEAYVYGYPLVFDLSEVQRFTQIGMGSLAAAPFNTFSHATKLAGPDDKFVSVNNDTIYSIAQLDLSGGPLLLDVPDSGGRYYVLQFVDAWTDNFAYVGTRATGTARGSYLLTPPGWEGDVPVKARQIAVPTAVATIVGRWACDGEADVSKVAVLQGGLVLEPYGDPGPTAGIPSPSAGVPDELAFFEKLRVWMQAFPPSAADQDFQHVLGPLGLLDAPPASPSPYVDPPDFLVAALVNGREEAMAEIEQLTRAGTTVPLNGWHNNPHLFDYNVDHLGLGTVDQPQWRFADRRRARQVRAVAARVGLWGNHGYEAVYAQVFEDADGRQLNGADRYTITFAEPPPVDAFWSLTMYDTPDYYLVDNPIGRYSIGDRTPGLRHGADGSLTVHLQHDEPHDEPARSNWLPAPEGDFRPMLRLYQPRPAVLDGSYVLPPVIRSP